MAQETLSVKLCELDDSFRRLRSRICFCETAGQEQLRREICALKQECTQEEQTLWDSLRRSKSELAGVLADSYGQIEQILEQAKAQMGTLAAQRQKAEVDADEKALLAEYMLDIAQRVADRVLLISMEAIDAQRRGQKEEDGK